MIPVNEPLLKGNEKKYLMECIDSGWISSEGPFVKKFEESFSKKVGRSYGVAVCNGTVAIDVALEALGIGAGDEVIMPAFTIISCISYLVRIGAKPILVDSDLSTWNMSVSQIESKITSRTKAIMVVHIYGLPVNMDPIMDIAARYGLKIIEDAAEMHGQTYKGKPCGSFGDISTFSFYPNKHITTGEGGMVVTNDQGLFEKCQSLRNLCFIPEKRFVHESLGWNYRMTNMQAAIGLAQLEQLDEFVLRKRRMGKLYSELLADITCLQLPLTNTDYADNIYWVYGVLMRDCIAFDASEAMARLSKLGVGTRPFFYPMHQQPVLNRLGMFKGERYVNAEKMYQRGFYIPSGMAIKDHEIASVAKSLKEVFSEYI